MHEPGMRYRADSDRSNQLLVAARPTHDDADTHWLRADVDHFRVRAAVARVVKYGDEVALDAIDWNDAGAVLHGRHGAPALRVCASFVVDASGPHGFLARRLKIPEPGFDRYPATQALFSHFTDVARCDQLPDYS